MGRDWLAAVLGLALSLVLSVLLFYTTSVTAGEALIIGLVGSSLALLVELLIRVEVIRDEAGAIGRAGQHAPRLRGIAQVAADIGARGGLADRELKKRLDQLDRDLTELHKGRIRSEGNDYRHLIEAAQGAGRQILGLNSLRAGEPDWWETEAGKRYWEANVDALQRGVRISRIFIYDQIDPQLAGLLQRQRASGVDVRVVQKDAIQHSHHVNVALVDDGIGWQAFSNAQGFQYENVLMLAPADLAHLQRIYSVCEGVSTSRW